MGMRTLVIIILIISAAVFGWQYIKKNSSELPHPTVPNIALGAYLRENISELSPIKEQVGGTFYVTKIEAYGKKGVVHYEDGHNAYVADFLYEIGSGGNVVVSDFVIRE